MNGRRVGVVAAPVSKSHLHRLLIADFLAGEDGRLADEPSDAADILATKRCLRALGGVTRTDFASTGATVTRTDFASTGATVTRTDFASTGATAATLDCGESGSTLRFLAPVAAALGVKAEFVRHGRLAARPFRAYETLAPGRHALAGDVSSQFVTGLLFALPLLKGDSEIRFTTPLESRGYVDLTLEVLKGAGIAVREVADGFDVPGGQRYRAQPSVRAEGDWSGAAFWLAMNALGSCVTVTGLNENSKQPDRAIVDLLGATAIDVSSCPDIFPVLTVVAAARDGATHFTGTRRLRLKESDRVAAMADVLGRLGRETSAGENDFTVFGSSAPFPGGGAFTAFGDHRIAMSVAVAATHAAGPLFLDDIRCADKSYPEFFRLFGEMI